MLENKLTDLFSLVESKKIIDKKGRDHLQMINLLLNSGQIAEFLSREKIDNQSQLDPMEMLIGMVVDYIIKNIDNPKELEDLRNFIWLKISNQKIKN